MVDLPDVLAERLRDVGYKDAKTRRLSDISKGGIAIRRIPSATTSSYYDGSRAIAYLVQVVVARQSEVKAIEEIEDIAALVPSFDLRSKNGSYTITSCEIYSEPAEIKTGTWEVKFKASITTKG